MCKDTTFCQHRQEISNIFLLFLFFFTTPYTLSPTGSWRIHTILSLYRLCGYYEISIWLLYDSYPLLIPLVWYLIIGDCNNSDRISRKSRNWLSAIREIRYLRYLLFGFSTIKNQELNKTIEISADTFSYLLKSPQKLITHHL